MITLRELLTEAQTTSDEPAPIVPLARSKKTSKLNQFVSDLTRSEQSPRGYWANPKDLDYDYLAYNYYANTESLHPYPEFTLNSQIKNLSGRDQVIRIHFLTPKEIPAVERGPRERSYVTATEWALREGYQLPDLRALEFIWHHREEAKKLNPKLFNDLKGFLKKTGIGGISAFFAGSIIWRPYIVNFPYLSLTLYEWLYAKCQWIGYSWEGFNGLGTGDIMLVLKD